ncbi:MAG: hypothetical protein QM813_16930 [Verrucomicrobiota bacterium]
MTPEEAAYQQQIIARRQQVAQQMAQQAATEPLSWGNDRYRHSPLEGVAKLIQAYAAGKAGKQAMTQGADLEKQTGALADQAQADYNTTRAQEASPAVPLAAGGGQIDEIPGGPRQAIADALSNPWSRQGLKQTAQMDFQSLENEKARAENAANRKEDRQMSIDAAREAAQERATQAAALAKQQIEAKAESDRQHNETLRALAAMRAASAGPANERKDRAQVIQLRKEFDALPAVQNYRLVLPQYERAMTAPNTRAGDLSVVYALGKIFDPTSVVREGELELSKDAQPWLQKMVNAAKSQMSGQGALDPKTRADITEAMRGQVEALGTQYRLARGNYSQYAEAMEAKPFDVVGDEPITKQPSVPAQNDVPTATGPGGKKLYLRNGQWVDK